MLENTGIDSHKAHAAGQRIDRDNTQKLQSKQYYCPYWPASGISPAQPP
jgi:hypothetical protein